MAKYVKIVFVIRLGGKVWGFPPTLSKYISSLSYTKELISESDAKEQKAEYNTFRHNESKREMQTLKSNQQCGRRCKVKKVSGSVKKPFKSLEPDCRLWGTNNQVRSCCARACEARVPSSMLQSRQDRSGRGTLGHPWEELTLDTKISAQTRILPMWTWNESLIQKNSISLAWKKNYASKKNYFVFRRNTRHCPDNVADSSNNADKTAQTSHLIR